ncbi:MAG: molecular chaperone DnaJ [Candidatus Gastranaerophilales bacterium]|nr:molecular chaperone DnaJ [Candidatus Gastranaerophilales bacterium]
MAKDYYEILGVPKDASQSDIKNAFRQQARKLHPDVNKAPDAEERFKELGQAYEVLSNEEKRAMYDRYGAEGLENAGFDTSGPFAGGFGDLSEILASFFGGGDFGGFGGFGGGRNPNGPRRGSDLRLDIKLEFKEAVFGAEKEVEIEHLETCKTCNGSGAKHGSSPVTCPRCHGTGQVRQETRTIMGSFVQVGACPDCHGKGQIIKDKCPDCQGRGVKEVTSKINLKIPAGVDNGSQMRIASQGDAGTNGGSTGDLYVVLHVLADKKFKRDEFNLYTTENITFSQAVLGDSIEIETLDGKETLNISPYTQTDSIIKVKGKGVPYLNNSSKRGDLFVKVVVVTPTNISSEEKKLYQRLYEIENDKKSKESIFDKMKDAVSGHTK